MSTKSKNVRRNKQELTNQQSIEKRLSKIEARTLSNQTAAKTINSLARSTDKQPLPTSNDFLALAGSVDHDGLKRGDSVHPLINNNIEESLNKQKFTTCYFRNDTVTTGQSLQYVISSATSSSADSDTPKSFNTKLLANVDGAGLWAVPGPVTRTAGGHPSAAVIRGNVNSDSAVMTETGQSTSPVGFFESIAPITPCPWAESAASKGSELRWQLVSVEVKVVNNTIGVERGGVAFVMQTTNKFSDLLGAVRSPGDFMNRGIFRTYEDMNIGDPEKPNDWARFAVRDGLCAYHNGEAGNTAALDGSALIISFSNSTASMQRLIVEIKCHWSLAGSATRGIAKPHVVCQEAADRASEANQVMRAANIIPSDQKGKENIPAALALHSSPALQMMHNIAHRSPALTISKGVYDTAHPLIKTIKKYAGRHLPRLVASGVQGLLKAASSTKL
jgi:hypothetical protein